MNCMTLRTPLGTVPVWDYPQKRAFRNPFSLFTERSFDSSEGPAVLVYETSGEFVVQAELPGWSVDQITIDFEDQKLKISGNRPLPSEEGRTYLRIEGFYPSFTRSFHVPKSVDGQNIKATLREGVLTVQLPKREAAKPHQIEIQSTVS